MKVRKFIEILLVAIIFGFIASAAFLLFTELFSTTGISARESFYGAFMGAFFAFIFVRISEALTKFYDRMAKNQSALVKLQFYLNDCLSLLGDNVYTIDNYFNIFSNYGSDAPEPKLFGNELHQIPIDNNLVVSLTNIEFINDLYVINTELRKLNDSVNSMNRMLEQTTRAFIEKHIDHKTYAANIEHYKPNMDTLRKFMYAGKKDITKALAVDLVLLRDENFLSRAIRFFMPTKYTNSQREQIPIETKRVEEEIEIYSRKRRERIDAVEEDNYS